MAPRRDEHCMLPLGGQATIFRDSCPFVLPYAVLWPASDKDGLHCESLPHLPQALISACASWRQCRRAHGKCSKHAPVQRKQHFETFSSKPGMISTSAHCSMVPTPIMHQLCKPHIVKHSSEELLSQIKELSRVASCMMGVACLHDTRLVVPHGEDVRCRVEDSAHTMPHKVWHDLIFVPLGSCLNGLH